MRRVFVSDGTTATAILIGEWSDILDTTLCTADATTTFELWHRVGVTRDAIDNSLRVELSPIEEPRERLAAAPLPEYRFPSARAAFCHVRPAAAPRARSKLRRWRSLKEKRRAWGLCR